MTDRSPQLAEVLRAVLEHRLSSLHVCMPGIVQSYDVTKQTCSVKPAFTNVIVAGAGEQEIDYPVISDVPVAFPRAGDWFVHFPLNVNDTVMLHFAERSLDNWRQLGGTQNPLDLRKHDLSDAIAVPCSLYDDAHPIAGLAADHLTIGKQGGSTIHVNADGTIGIGSAIPGDSAARASIVDANMSALAAALTAWVPVPSDGGAALKVILTALLATGWPTVSPSSIVKVSP